MNYHGQTALQTAVLVAFTQLIPEHQVQFFGAFSVRVKVTLFSRVISPPLPFHTPLPPYPTLSVSAFPPRAVPPVHASAIPSRPFCIAY